MGPFYGYSEICLAMQWFLFLFFFLFHYVCRCCWCFYNVLRRILAVMHHRDTYHKLLKKQQRTTNSKRYQASKYAAQWYLCKSITEESRKAEQLFVPMGLPFDTLNLCSLHLVCVQKEENMENGKDKRTTVINHMSGKNY